MANEYPILEQVNNNAGTLSKPVVGATLASAATIAPTYRVHHVSGVAAISTITLPWTDFGGTIAFIADGLFSWTTGGNINSAGSVQSVGSIIFCTYDPSAAKWFLSAANVPGVTATGAVVPQTIRVRTTTANVNTGSTLLPAITGLKYRLTDIAMIAIGGNAATATTVDIKGTQSSSVVKLFAVAVAQLTQSAVVKPGTVAATAPLTDGACFQACDAATAITIGSTTNNLATATNIDTILTFVIEP